MREDLRNDKNKGWVDEVIIEYNPDSFQQFNAIKEIQTELKQLDPKKNSNHDFMYLFHLNREASRIVTEINHPHHENISQALFHTANKDIWSVMIFSYERVDRTKEFESAINYMKMDIGHL